MIDTGTGATGIEGGTAYWGWLTCFMLDCYWAGIDDGGVYEVIGVF